MSTTSPGQGPLRAARGATKPDSLDTPSVDEVTVRSVRQPGRIRRRVAALGLSFAAMFGLSVAVLPSPARTQ